MLFMDTGILFLTFVTIHICVEKDFVLTEQIVIFLLQLGVYNLILSIIAIIQLLYKLFLINRYLFMSSSRKIHNFENILAIIVVKVLRILL